MKLLGIAALLFSGAGISFFLAREEDIKLLRTRAWLELVLLVRSSVESYSLSISKILSRCDSGLLLRLGYPEWRTAPQSLIEIADNVVIPDRESEEAVMSFLGDFGKNYREYQVSRCDDCIRKLQERERLLSGQVLAKKKVIFAVSLCAVAALVILLL